MQIELITNKLKLLIDSEFLNDRIEAGKVLKDVKDKRLFKEKYKSFKTYYVKELNLKSKRVDYILAFYEDFKEMEKFLSHTPATIDQVNALRYQSNDFMEVIWNLSLVRFNYDLDKITRTEMDSLKMWLLGLSPLKLKHDDNRNFLKYIYKLQLDKSNKFFKELEEVRTKMFELENKYNKLDKEYIELKNDLELYKKLYKLERSIKKNDKSSYDILGIKAGCSTSDVKKAFRQLSLEYHPDKVEGLGLSPAQKKLFSDKFLEIKKAYDLLNRSI